MNYIKLTSVFLLTIIIASCQQDDPFEELNDHDHNIDKDQSGIQVCRVNYDDDENLQNLMQQSFPNLPSGRTLNSAVGELNTDNIMVVTDHDTEETRYSFSVVKQNNDLSFQNVIIKDNNQGISSFIIEYAPTIDWIINGNNNFLMYSGKIIYKDINGNPTFQTEFINGKIKSNVYSNGRILCDGQNSESTEEGNGDTSGGDSGGGGGSGGGSSTPSHGGTTFIFIIEEDETVLEVNDRDLVSRVLCGGTYAAGGSGTSGINGILDLSPLLADNWKKNKVTLTKKFMNDPCLMEIWNKAMDTNEAYEMLGGFLQDYPVAELTIDVTNNTNDLIAASPKFWGDLLNTYGFSINYLQEQYVYLNMRNINDASNIFIATILGHELIHASMMEYIYANTFLISDSNYDLIDIQNNFPLLFDLWVNQNLGPEGASHETMALHYRTQLKDFIKEMDILMNGKAINSDIYDALSWIGLEGTAVFDNAVETGKANFNSINDIKNEELSKGKCN